MIRALTCVVAVCSCVAIAQNPGSAETHQADVVIVKLSPPAYPSPALQAHVSGDVEVTLDIRLDGTVESATAVNGPPMLRQAALDSARQTRFECKGCSDRSTRFQMTYRFVLGGPIYCTGPEDSSSASRSKESYPQVTESLNTVTITGQPVGTCDPANDRVRARSVKCLYLWKCGWRPMP